MKLPWKKENAAHKAPGGGKRRSFDLKAALTTRAVRVGGYSVAAAAIVIAIIVAANALVRALPAQWTQFDTTSSQLFSISDQTESVEGSLETPVTIHWIVQSGQEDATLETLLERYQALSENLTVEKVDPVVSPTFLEQYNVGSVYNNSLIVESEARYRYVDYYDIYEYDYTNYYTTGSVDMNFAGEGAITSAVSYVVNDDLPKVYTLTGHGEGSLSSDFQSAAEQDNVEFEELSLLSAETVPEDADCVLILAPQSDIADVELTALQAYLDGGGRLLLITDPPQEGAELLPTRQDLAALYRKLVSLKGDGFSAQSLAAALPGFGLGKLLLCLDMLQERRLVALLGGEERKSAEILPTQGKVDIFASPVFQRAEALVGKQG